MLSGFQRNGFGHRTIGDTDIDVNWNTPCVNGRVGKNWEPMQPICQKVSKMKHFFVNMDFTKSKNQP
jgi:hypothetical protein